MRLAVIPAVRAGSAVFAVASPLVQLDLASDQPLGGRGLLSQLGLPRCLRRVHGTTSRSQSWNATPLGGAHGTQRYPATSRSANASPLAGLLPGNGIDRIGTQYVVEHHNGAADDAGAVAVRAWHDLQGPGG